VAHAASSKVTPPRIRRGVCFIESI
jgi:hypothetical protein